MKAKNIIIVQIILLVCAIAAGALLKGNLADGPRLLHRIFGSLAGIVGLTSAVYITINSKKAVPKLLLWIAAALTLLAGYSGNSLKTTSDYDSTFMMMRGSAVMALVLAVVVLVKIGKKTK